MRYTPGPLPSGTLTPERIMETLFRELLELARTSTFADAIELPYLNAPPSKTNPGMIVNADGTNWNPGSGQGTYRRNLANNAWVFLG